MSKLIRTGDSWILPLQTTEVVQIYATLVHAKRNNIKPTQEDYVAVCNWIKKEIVKSEILDKEIAKVNEYTNKETAKHKTKNRKCKAKGNDNT